jgi:hypothetical protein
MRWAVHAAGMGERRVLVENLRQKANLEDPGRDGRIIFNWIFKKWDGDMDWIDLAQNKNR